MNATTGFFNLTFGLTNDGSAQAVAPSFTVGLPFTWKAVMEIDPPPYQSTMAHTHFNDVPVLSNYRTVSQQLSSERPIHPGDSHQVMLTTMYVPVGAHVIRWRSTCGDLLFPPDGSDGDYDFEVTQGALEQGRESAARADEKGDE